MDERQQPRRMSCQPASQKGELKRSRSGARGSRDSPDDGARRDWDLGGDFVLPVLGA